MGITIDGAGTITGLDADGISAQPVFPGQVLQVVSTTKTDTYSVTLGAGANDTNNFMSASITPTSATSKILIFVHTTAGGSSGINSQGFVLFRDSTQICLGDADGVRARRSTTGSSVTTDNNAANNHSFNFLDDPSTTTSVTYGVRLSNVTGSTGTYYINRSLGDSNVIQRTRGTSTITLMEIAG